MRQIVFIILVLTTPFLALSQNVVLVTKEEVVAKAIENNNSIKISKQDIFSAKGDFNQTNAILLPNISISHTAIATTNPLMAFGSKLNQGILTANDFNPTLLNNPSQIENYATTIEVQQPLINLDGLYQRKAAKAKLKATTLLSERTEDYIVLEVEKAYMQLQLAYRAVNVLEKALEAAMENNTLAKNSFEQGYLQRADVLAMEVRVTEVKNNLQSAKSNVENASDYLSFLMDDNGGGILQPLDSLSISTNSLKKEYVVLEERLDVKAMEHGTDAYAKMYKADKMAFLPRLNAFGSYELYDDEIFKADASGYLFGAQLRWDIFQGSKRIGKAQKSKAEYEKSKLQYKQYVSQSNLELNKAKRQLLDYKNKLELTKLAVNQSKESLRIRTNRFKEGLEKTSDLLLTETQYAQKQLEYYQTVFEHNYAQAYLEFLMK